MKFHFLRISFKFCFSSLPEYGRTLYQHSFFLIVRSSFVNTPFCYFFFQSSSEKKNYLFVFIIIVHFPSFVSHWTIVQFNGSFIKKVLSVNRLFKRIDRSVKNDHFFKSSFETILCLVKNIVFQVRLERCTMCIGYSYGQ